MRKPSLRLLGRVLGRCLLVVALAGLASRAMAADQFQVAGWQGNTWFNGKRFVACAIKHDFSGTMLTIAVTSGSDAVVVIKAPGIKKITDATAPVHLTVDKGYDGTGTAKINGGAAYLVIRQGAQFVSAVKSGKTLAAKIKDQDFSFALTGTMAALTQVEQCVATNAAKATSAAQATQPAPIAGTRSRFAGPVVSTSAASVFGAIAISKSTGHVGVAWNQQSRSAAEKAAIAACSTKDCVSALWFRNACGALAAASNGTVGADWGASLAKAQSKALAACSSKGAKDCAVIDSQCTN